MREASPNTEDKLTLHEYQNGEGIPFEDQILLVHNETPFRDYHPVLYPWTTLSVTRWLKECVRYRTVFVPRKGQLVSFSRSTKLFLGYYDRSFDKLEKIKELFRYIRSYPNRKFQVMIGKTDLCLPPDIIDQLPPNVDFLCMNNADPSGEKIRYLPMGRDFRSLSIIKSQCPTAHKYTLCYANFSVDTHPIRAELSKHLSNKDFVRVGHLGTFRNYEISREQFFSDLSGSKFCICPRGNAYDTFRMWDCLYQGTVPIVVKEAGFHNLLTKLPILFLDSYQQIMNLEADWLEQRYQEMLETRYDYRLLKIQNWISS